MLVLACRSEPRRGSEPTPPHAAEPLELHRIVRMPAAELATRLRSFRATERSHAQVERGGQVLSALDETVDMEVDGNGQWHGKRDNSREQGVEAWGTPGQLTVRMRYGKPVRRRAEGRDAEQLREDMLGGVAAYYEVVERFVESLDRGESTEAGRTARRVELRLRGSPRPAAAEREPARQWRSRLWVQALDGEVVADARTSAPLRVDLKTRFSYPEEGGEMTVELQLERTLRDVGAVSSIALPEDSIASPTRPRYEILRRELLEGLVADRQAGGRK
jgi:hypothetical protein